MGFQIAIDGPAGAGKSTIAKRVANELGLVYIDTGAMYRAMALYFIRRGISIRDEEAVTAACTGIDVRVSHEDGIQVVWLNGENVNDLILSEEVGNVTSVVASLRAVREKLMELQRLTAKGSDVVMDGRDIGTCVLPAADLKIYLTADARERARRRQKQILESGGECDIDQIEKDIVKRDRQDMTREIAPLTQAADAVVLDSTNEGILEVVQKILALYREMV